MKCPYQTIVIHIPKYIGKYEARCAEDITKFIECLKEECPYYQSIKYNVTNQIVETCRKVESEVNNESNKGNIHS